jgi:hypothetical protein
MGTRSYFPGGKEAGVWSWPLTSIYCFSAWIYTLPYLCLTYLRQSLGYPIWGFSCLYVTTQEWGSRDSSVSMVSGLRTGCPGFNSQQEQGFFFPRQRPDRFFCADSLISTAYRDPSPWGKAAGAWSDHSSPLCSEVKNELILLLNENCKVKSKGWKVKSSLCFNRAPRYEGILGNGGIAPPILWSRH